jgi:hypothetical protein
MNSEAAKDAKGRRSNLESWKAGKNLSASLLRAFAPSLFTPAP